MKTFVPFFLLTALLLLALVAQDIFPCISLLGQMPLLLVPTIFCFTALALSFPAALCFALITAILTGLMVMQLTNDHAEIGLGWFILFFMSWVILLQFLSSLTEGVRWEVHAIGSLLCTATFLLGEFFLLSVRRGGFIITGRAFSLMIVPSMASLFMAPLFYGFLQFFLPPAIPVKK